MSKIPEASLMKGINPSVNECSPDGFLTVWGDRSQGDFGWDLYGPASPQPTGGQNGIRQPSLEDFNFFVTRTNQRDYNSLVNQETDGSSALWRPLTLSQNPSVPAGDFPECDVQMSAMRKQFPIPLSLEVAEYLKSKLEDDAGCTDGEWVKLLPNAPALQRAISSIEEDINSGEFPDGVDEWMAEDLISNLQTVADWDPMVVQERSMQEQMWEQGEIGIMGAARLFFARIFPGSCDN